MSNYEMTADEYVAYQRTGKLPQRLARPREMPDMPEKAKRKNKYGAVRTEVDGVIFDSKAEARRYQELCDLVTVGAIRDLELQPVYPLRVGEATVGKYVADFRYVDVASGETVVEDVKSKPTKTPLYRWKRRHVAAQYGIEVVEIHGKTR